MSSKNNTLASTLKSLHVPSKPLVLANIWDIPSLNALLSLNSAAGPDKPVRAVATASWAVAASLGIEDEELTLDQNLDAIRRLAPLVARASLPFSVDLQDGYGSRIVEAVTSAVEAGAHGANLEDSIPAEGFGKGISGSLYGVEEAVSRIRTALKTAAEAGCPDFTLNARCDVFVLAASEELDDDTRLEEALRRGRAYLDAGATTVFYWGAALNTEHIKTLVAKLDGRVAISQDMGPGAASTAALAELGVARISVGPKLHLIAMEAMKKSALSILQGGNL